MSDNEYSVITNDVIKSFDCTFQNANNKGADQTAQMRRLVCAVVFWQTTKDRFSHVAAHLI